MHRAVSVALVFCLFSPMEAQAQLPTIGVTAFQFKGVEDAAQSQSAAYKLQDVIISSLTKSGKFRATKVSDSAWNAQGDLDSPSALKVGKRLGVQYLLTGAVTQEKQSADGGGQTAKTRRRGGRVQSLLPYMEQGSLYRMQANLLDVRTGKIVWSDVVQRRLGERGAGQARKTKRGSSLQAAMQSAAQQLIQKLNAAAL